jgi:photosystem II stability/assembly factor-like uncharacterized protein
MPLFMTAPRRGSALAVFLAVLTVASACELPSEVCNQVPEGLDLGEDLCPPPVTVDNEVAPGWVLEQPFPEVESLHDVVVLAEGNVYAVGTDGTVLHLVDDEWVMEEVPTTVDLRAIDGFTEENLGDFVVVVGDGGVVLRKQDDAWELVSTPTSDEILFDVWVRNRQDAFVVGDNGTFLRVNQTDAAPMTAEAAQTRFVRGNACNPGNPVCPAGASITCQQIDAMDPNSPNVCYDTNHPEGLLEEQFFRADPIKGVVGTGEDRVFAVGPRGLIMRFDGLQWTCENSGTARSITSVFAGGGVWATAQDGVLLRRSGDFEGDPTNCADAPINWDSTSYRLPVPIFLRDVWASGGNDVFVVGLAGAIYQFNGGEWINTSLDDDIHLRAVDGIVLQYPDEEQGLLLERDVYAVGAGGRILHGPEIISDREKERLAAQAAAEAEADAEQ